MQRVTDAALARFEAVSSRLLVALILAVAVLLVGCAPSASAPLGDTSRICRWVREAVASGAMTLDMAQDWYAYCGPFEVPQ